MLGMVTTGTSPSSEPKRPQSSKASGKNTPNKQATTHGDRTSSESSSHWGFVLSKLPRFVPKPGAKQAKSPNTTERAQSRDSPPQSITTSTAPIAEGAPCSSAPTESLPASSTSAAPATLSGSAKDMGLLSHPQRRMSNISEDFDSMSIHSMSVDETSFITSSASMDDFNSMSSADSDNGGTIKKSTSLTDIAYNRKGSDHSQGMTSSPSVGSLAGSGTGAGLCAIKEVPQREQEGGDLKKRKSTLPGSLMIPGISTTKIGKFMLKCSLPTSVTGGEHEYIYKGHFATQTIKSVQDVEFYAQAHTWKSKDDYVVPHGRGSITIVGRKSPIYEGEFRLGMRHGQGKGLIHFENTNATYNGKWLEGRRHGLGVYLSQSFRYDGNFVNSHREGYGVCEYDKEGGVDRYQGYWKDDMHHGTGTYWFHSGTVYTGQWKNGARGGYGLCKYANGDEYVGEWDQGWRHGQGMIYYANNVGIYKGGWFNDSRHGEGVLYGVEGKVVYDGEWRDGTRTGKGLGINAFYTYTGIWRGGQRHGPGVCEYPNGDKYEGWFSNNMRAGKGTMVYSEESSQLVAEYHGCWEGDMWSGPAQVVFRCGGTLEAEFNMGKLESDHLAVYQYKSGKKSASTNYFMCCSAAGAHVETYRERCGVARIERMSKLVERMTEARANMLIVSSIMRDSLPAFTRMEAAAEVEDFEGLLVLASEGKSTGSHSPTDELYVPEGACVVKCRSFYYNGEAAKGIFCETGTLDAYRFFKCTGKFKKGIFTSGNIELLLKNGKMLEYNGDLSDFAFHGEGTVVHRTTGTPAFSLPSGAGAYEAKITAVWEKGAPAGGKSGDSSLHITLSDGTVYTGGLTVRKKAMLLNGRVTWPESVRRHAVKVLSEADELAVSATFTFALDMKNMCWDEGVHVENASVNFESGLLYQGGANVVILDKSDHRPVVSLVAHGKGMLSHQDGPRSTGMRTVRGEWKDGVLCHDQVVVFDPRSLCVYRGPCDSRRKYHGAYGVCVYGRANAFEGGDDAQPDMHNDEVYMGGWLEGNRHGKGFYRAGGESLNAQCSFFNMGSVSGATIHMFEGEGIFLRDYTRDGQLSYTRQVRTMKDFVELVKRWGYEEILPRQVVKYIKASPAEFGLDLPQVNDS